MEYLLKVSAIIAIFYVCYKLFLQRDTFFEANRWFLLTGLVASFVIPFMVIPVYVEYTPVDVSAFTVQHQATPIAQENPFNPLDYLPLIYGLGVAFFGIRFLFQLTSLIRLISKNQGYRKDAFTFIETRQHDSPFSFFKWIVFNPHVFKDTELAQIIMHEKVHAKQLHSIDILTAQFCCAVLWFNPLMWLYNKDLKQNLEFIADKKTLDHYNCKKSYQYTLLKTSIPSHQMALSNHFYNSLIKKRIVMLHKSKSKKINQLKFLLVVPALITFLISCNSEVIEKDQQLKTNPITKFGFLINDLNNNQQPLFVLNGKVISSEEMKAIILDSIRSMNVIKDESAIAKYGEKAKNGVIEINTGWKTKFIIGKPFKIDTNLIGYNTKGDGLKIRSNYIEIHDGKPSTATYRITGSSTLNGEPPLVIVDGIEIKTKVFEIQNDNIESTNVLKGERAIKEYGDKGKNGVIEITTKK